MGNTNFRNLFIFYGDVKQAIDNNDFESFYNLLTENPISDKKVYAGWLKDCCKSGNIDMANFLLNNCDIDLSIDNFQDVMENSIMNGQKNVFHKFLIYFKDKKLLTPDLMNPLLISACEYNKPEMLSLIIEYGDPTQHNNHLLMYAIKNGHEDIFEILLKDPRIDPSVSNNKALKIAHELTRFDIVELLITDARVNPMINNGALIKDIFLKKNPKMLFLLLCHNKVNPSINTCLLLLLIKNYQCQIKRNILLPNDILNLILIKVQDVVFEEFRIFAQKP
jgi:hypothetical protein